MDRKAAVAAIRSGPEAMMPAPPADSQLTRSDRHHFRDVMGRFATGVTVITVVHEDQVRGMTANAFTAVSLDPLLILICLRRGSATVRLLEDVPHFGVNILSDRQQSIARWFADPRRPDGRAQMDAVGWRAGGATGVPLIHGSVAWLECQIDQQAEIGDHVVVYGRVVGLGATAASDTNDAGPLVFHRGAFGALGELPELSKAG